MSLRNFSVTMSALHIHICGLDFIQSLSVWIKKKLCMVDLGLIVVVRGVSPLLLRIISPILLMLAVYCFLQTSVFNQFTYQQKLSEPTNGREDWTRRHMQA